MIYLKFFSLLFLFLSFSLRANEVQIIELYQNKSLDQLVLETENNNKLSQDQSNNNQILEVESTIDEITQTKEVTDVPNVKNEDLNKDTEGENIQDEDELINNNSDSVTILKQEILFDINENIINNHLSSIKEIKSKTLQREFINILSNPDIENQKNINKTIYSIIKKLYEIGEIGKAYNLIKNIDISILVNNEHINYFHQIELNYLFSTFKLSNACELKTTFMEQGLSLPKNLLEKTDIFCLTLENKFAEAKLLNSLLVESENEIDQNFQKLFEYMTIENQEDANFESLTSVKSRDLIFLYSAMLRINELPLDEDFINIDPLNLSIPVILSNSTKMSTRIKAANKAYFDESLSIDSLSALYQSVDFNSNDFIKPNETIKALNENKELVMAFYYQLANIQIFPDDRLNIILKYWEFAKNLGIEKIAYAMTKNIIETFTPNSDNTKHAMEIALAHISNNNFIEASRWINFNENYSNDSEKVKYAEFLISLNETDELSTIINYLSNNYSKLNYINNQKTLETIEVLNNFLSIEEKITGIDSYNIIIDDRSMPSYFLIKDIKNNIKTENNLSLFLLTLISMDNKNWDELHPEHLKIILNALNSYDQGSLIKPIILEILNELNII